jgi:hypothetical protein
LRRGPPDGIPLDPADAREYASSSNPPLNPRRSGVPRGRPPHHGPPGHRGSFVPAPAISIFLGGEVASNRSFASSWDGTADVPVHSLRLIGPSRPPGDPAQLGVPGHRPGLSLSRRANPAVRKATKVATQYGTPRGWGRPGIGTMPSQNQEVRPEMVSGTFFPWRPTGCPA